MPKEMYALVQMHMQDSKLWPLKVLRLTWYDGNGWLFENSPGYFRVLAVFDTKDHAKVARRILSPCRYFRDEDEQRFLLPSLMEIGSILQVMQIAGLPGCLYKYTYRKESFSQWLSQQRP